MRDFPSLFKKEHCMKTSRFHLTIVAFLGAVILNHISLSWAEEGVKQKEAVFRESR